MAEDKRLGSGGKGHDTKEKRAGTGKGYDLAETIVVPQVSSQQAHHHVRRSDLLPPNDPQEIVRKFWQGSFTMSRKRKLTQTKSKIRQQMLLSEELQRLENESRLWRDVFSELSGS